MPPNRSLSCRDHLQTTYEDVHLRRQLLGVAADIIENARSPDRRLQPR